MATTTSNGNGFVPVTDEEIRTAQEFWTPGLVPGAWLRWRRNGATTRRAPKRRPDEFRLPVKHGLYMYDTIRPDNRHQFTARNPNAR